LGVNPNCTLHGLASLTRDLLHSLAAPALAPFLADWPLDVGPTATASSPEAAEATPRPAMPVLRYLPDIAADGRRFGAALIAEVCRNAEALAWRQTYSASELGDEFLRNYGWTEIFGSHAQVKSRHIACGFLLLGPNTFYPQHRHEAQEIYVPLSGTANWQQGDAIWRERPPGTVIHHVSEELHAMRTGAHPLLALYLWRSADLRQKARLAPPARN
jgi:hypothetical protein